MYVRTAIRDRSMIIHVAFTMSTDTVTTMPFMIKWSMGSWDICVDAVFICGHCL